jgi:hypothetical protein
MVALSGKTLTSPSPITVITLELFLPKDLMLENAKQITAKATQNNVTEAIIKKCLEFNF